MIGKLKSIYGNQIIENVENYNLDYYYFYIPSTSKVFGISKKISNKEYELLKLQYVEKHIYSANPKLSKIYSYLLENAQYPFDNKKLKMTIFKLHEDDEELVEELLSKIFDSFYLIKLFDVVVCFYVDDYSIKMNDFRKVISEDLGYDVILHDGIYISNSFKGEFVYKYIEIFTKRHNLNNQNYTDISDIILEFDQEDSKNILENIYYNIIKPLFNNSSNKDILDVMIKNDLNVSTTSKLLYMNRNSLINKLDSIYKETGLNLQKFKHACAIYLLTKLDNNNK